MSEVKGIVIEYDKPTKDGYELVSIGVSMKGSDHGYNHEALNFGGERKRKLYYCDQTNKRCGQNTTCNCFDDNGKLMFERK